jgi:transcriptional regulator with XRE-family HTH domain
VASSIPTRIRSARDDAGLTREQMAPQVGVTLRTLSRWESGETPGISFASLSRIAEVTGKPLAYFVTDEAAA